MVGHSEGMPRCMYCRRKTPPCSPHLHAAATGSHPAGDEGHDLRPAGSCMNHAQPMPSAATALFKEALHEPKQATSSTRIHSDQTPFARASGSPEPGQTACRGSTAAYNSPVATPGDDQSVLGRHRGVGEEQWVQGLAQRGHQVSRQGRAGGSRAGSSMPLHTAAASTPPLDSEQFGFVRLAASRYLGFLAFTPRITFCFISMVTVTVIENGHLRCLCSAHHTALHIMLLIGTALVCTVCCGSK